MVRQYASFTLQAIATSARRLGHTVFYAIYYGVGAPEQRLPGDLDVVFLSSYTQASALAYALGRLYRRRGTRTVFGGPHAKSFPRDCLRFFDIVVKECDEPLIADILNGTYDPGSIVTSAAPFEELPTVEERMPEIRASAFLAGRRYFASTIPLLASIGCPYDCGFFVDWNNPHRLLSTERLAADLAYVARNLPGSLVAYHDPNFAVKFDQTLDVIEAVPARPPNPYIVETSLTVLREPRIRRLGRTGCVAVVPGGEAWSAYSHKAGVGKATGIEKVDRVVEQFELLHAHVPYLQANFMFGLDVDAGDEPVRLTKDFVSRTPFVWPAINIPHPFGGTPLYDQYLDEDRILTAMPFSFYYAPYLVTRLKHYSAEAYYRKLLELFEHLASMPLLVQRLRATRAWLPRLVHAVRTGAKRHEMRAFRRIHAMLVEDRQFRAFHEGDTPVLPEFYHREYERLLGRYAALIPRADRTPVLERSRAPRPAATPALRRPSAPLG